MTINTSLALLKIFGLMFLVSACAGLPAPENADVAWIATGEFCEPETVLPLPDKTFLVSNVCGFKQSRNGYLSLIDARGQVLDSRVVDDLDAPLGMALVSGRLYVVDANRVRVFLWPGYAPVETIDLDTRVANDIAVAADGTIYVSDSARHQVVRRDQDGSQRVVTGKAQFESANGMAIRGDQLYVGGARLWSVNLPDESVTTIGPSWLADIDGIEFENGGTLQVTIVGGPLIRYRSKHDVQVIGGEGVSSTNHGYSAEFGLALIPTGYDNTVIAVKITE